MAVRVAVADTTDPEVIAGLARLLPQLSESAMAPTVTEIETLIAQQATRLLLAWDGDDIVGILTLVIVRLPTGVKALIEDVVVDEAARGKRAGTTLVEAALDHARADGAAFVDLTSNPSRVAANEMYQRIRFAQRSTNVYRYGLTNR